MSSCSGNNSRHPPRHLSQLFRGQNTNIPLSFSLPPAHLFPSRLPSLSLNCYLSLPFYLLCSFLPSFFLRSSTRTTQQILPQTPSLHRFARPFSPSPLPSAQFPSPLCLSILITGRNHGRTDRRLSTAGDITQRPLEFFGVTPLQHWHL